MKVSYQMAKGEVIVEGGDVKECFEELAHAVEVFGHSQCGACESMNVVPSVREAQGNTYYEVRCQDCGAALSFGQTRVGNRLYPRRKDKSGNYLPGNGWTKWQGAAKSASHDDAF